MIRISRRSTKSCLILWRTPTIRSFHSSQPSNFELISVIEPAHNALQNLHTFTGLEWHTFIPLSTILLRTTFTLPISVMNRIRSRKQMELQPLLSGMGPILKARLAASPAAKEGQLTREQIEVLSAKEKRKYRIKLFKKFKCQTWKSLVLLPTVQIPLWITMSLVIRSMCGWSAIEGIPIEPGFPSDYFLWYKDLISSDPYFALPLAIGAVNMANVEWNALNTLSPTARREKELQKIASEHKNNANTRVAMSGRSSISGPSIPGIISNMARGGTIVFMTIALQAPVALCLYWLSSNTYSLLQNILLDRFLPMTETPAPLKISPHTLRSEGKN